MVVDKKIKPRFMYREKRIRPEDSGWRIFTGMETDAYLDDPQNSGIYNPSTILAIDPSIETILLKGIGSVYERAGDQSDWYKVTDYKLEDDFMVTHRLTEKWTIQINNLFERKIEDSGDLLYTTGDKSVRLTIWNDANKNKEQLYQEHNNLINNRDQNKAATVNIFDFSDATVFRTGYLIKESDGSKSYDVIYGFSIIDNQVIQIALYFDEPQDQDWAITTWKNIRLLS
nr:DUF2185 domain-containing protein [Niabella beijingensis]